MSIGTCKWVRLLTDAVDDEKLRLLAFEDRWHFVALLCCKGQGILDDDDSLMRRKVAVKLGLHLCDLDDVAKRLSDFGLIDYATLQPRTDGVVFDPVRPPAHEWRVIRDAVFSRDNFTCVYCGRSGVRLECDHVIPVARGGQHDIGNLATACFDCNRSKRDKTVDEWRCES